MCLYLLYQDFWNFELSYILGYFNCKMLIQETNTSHHLYQIKLTVQASLIKKQKSINFHFVISMCIHIFVIIFYYFVSFHLFFLIGSTCYKNQRKNC